MKSSTRKTYNLKISMATLDFSFSVSEPHLVRPEIQTPHEIKYLSNIDDQMGLRNHIPFIHVYRRSNNGSNHDPGPIIRQALSRSLIYYYPLAGRLRNGEKKKLVVECTGEGVVYREADVDLTIGRLREANGFLLPPFRHLDKFLVDDVWGCNLTTDSPLLRVQVTRLACGGFILAYTFNHCICDGFGAHRFITAVAEFARNPTLSSLSVLPAWSREILAPRSPPKISYPHPEYDALDTVTPLPHAELDFRSMIQTSVFFSHADVASLKRQISNGPTFDAVASCLWRARTRALSLTGPTRLLFPVDTRARHHPLLPKTYYGAAVVFPCAAARATDLLALPLKHAAELISAVKAATSDDEYRSSTIDFIEVKNRRGFVSGREVFVVSDMSRLRFADVDFGWGSAVYGGPARAGTGEVPGMVTSVVGHRREEDDVEGLLALVSLAPEAVEAFHKEVREIVMDGFVPKFVRSALLTRGAEDEGLMLRPLILIMITAHVRF